MGRSPCCDESGLKKGPWTPEEDSKLVRYIQVHGHGSWRALPKLAGLNRCGKSCRLRWTNYLRPDIKRGKFSKEEEQTILNLHSIIGNKWSAIASHLPGRTDNEIKNFWNTHLKKKLIQMGIDPMTHRPKTDLFSSLPHLLALASLKDLLMDPHRHLQSSSPWGAAGAAQMSQYLQFLLQPPQLGPADSTNINAMNNIDRIDDLDTLLNTIKQQSPSTFSNHLLPFSDSLRPLDDSSIPFPHLPELQVPCTFQDNKHCDNVGLAVTETVAAASDNYGHDFGVISQPGAGEMNTFDSSWLAALSPVSPPAVPPALAAEGTSSSSDACSASSSYGGGGASPFWPDLQLIDDPLFHEFA